MTKLGTKWVRNDQNENKSGYEMTKMVRNDLGTKWPGYEMTGYQNSEGFETNETTQVFCFSWKVVKMQYAVDDFLSQSDKNLGCYI